MAKIKWSFLFQSGSNVQDGKKETCWLCEKTFIQDAIVVCLGAWVYNSKARQDDLPERVLGDEGTPICADCFEAGPKVCAERARGTAARHQMKALRTRDDEIMANSKDAAESLGIMSVGLEALKDFSDVYGYPMAAKVQEFYRELDAPKRAGRKVA